MIRVSNSPPIYLKVGSSVGSKTRNPLKQQQKVRTFFLGTITPYFGDFDEIVPLTPKQ